MHDVSASAGRPLADRVEVIAPSIIAFVARAVSRGPAPLRRRVLGDAFARAEAAFNRGDFEAIFALFADDVYYIPPPALGKGPINGRDAVFAFCRRPTVPGSRQVSRSCSRPDSVAASTSAITYPRASATAPSLTRLRAIVPAPLPCALAQRPLSGDGVVVSENSIRAPTATPTTVVPSR